MCAGPEVALALGATGLGNYMQAKENNASINAQYNARNAVQQQGYDQQKKNAAQAQDVLQPAIAGFQNPNQQADLGALITNRAAAINGNTTIPQTGNDIVSTQPKIVQDTLADKIGKAVAYNKQQGDALAALGSTGDQWLNNGIKLQDSGAKINTIDNFARAQQGVNNAQAESAYNNARKAANPLWGILSDIGTVAGADAFAGGGIANGATNGFASAEGAVNGAQAATGAPWLPTGDYYGAGV